MYNETVVVVSHVKLKISKTSKFFKFSVYLTMELVAVSRHSSLEP